MGRRSFAALKYPHHLGGVGSEPRKGLTTFDKLSFMKQEALGAQYETTRNTARAALALVLERISDNS